MGAQENIGSLWEQAIADENWALAAEYEAQLRHPEVGEEVSTENSGLQEQRAILSAETYWLGSIADHGSPSYGPRDIM